MKRLALAFSTSVVMLGAAAGAALANPSAVAPAAEPCPAQAGQQQADQTKTKRGAKRAGAKSGGQPESNGDAVCPLETQGALDRDIIRRKV